MHLEGCLPLMAGCNVNIVVASMRVELVDLCVPSCSRRLVMSGIRY